MDKNNINKSILKMPIRGLTFNVGDVVTYSDGRKEIITYVLNGTSVETEKLYFGYFVWQFIMALAA